MADPAALEARVAIIDDATGSVVNVIVSSLEFAQAHALKAGQSARDIPGTPISPGWKFDGAAFYAEVLDADGNLIARISLDPSGEMDGSGFVKTISTPV